MDGLTRLPKRGPAASPRLGGSPAIPSTTGYPWVDGDILYADDLNAAFVPTTGGTITATTSPALQIDFTNSNPVPPPATVVPGLLINTTSAANAAGFTWSINNILYTHAMGGGSTQDVATASSVFKYGAATTWQYFGQTIDYTGMDPVSNGSAIGIELNIAANGPDGAGSGANPTVGGRSFIELDINSYHAPGWTAATAYAVGAVVQPATPNGYVYVCTLAGTSGASAPVWPTSAGGVADGTAAWKWGTTLASQVSRAIFMGGASSIDQIGAGIMTTGYFYDAILEFSGAHLVDGGVKDAAIRLAAGMPIDFSGALTDASQNVRTLRYDGVKAQLIYNALGGDRFAVGDGGSVCLGSSTPTASVLLDVQGSATVGIFTGAGTFTTALRMNTGQHLSFSNTDSDILYLNATKGLTYANSGTDIVSFRGVGPAQMVFDVLPTNAANDAAASAAGVPVGGVYRNGSVLQVRVA